MKATTNQADPWKRPNRDDQWARVDYRSRAVAIIGVIATTLVAAVALTAYAGGLVVRLDRGGVLLRLAAASPTTAPVG